MARITIEINTDSAAFEDSFEVVRILQDLAKVTDNHGAEYLADLKIRDINGNVVGVCTIEENDSDMGDEEEQTRRDEKNGLYSEFVDDAN